MKEKDAKYYEEQINVFTPCKAKVKDNELLVDFMNGSSGRAETEDQAEALYQKARKMKGI